MNAFNSSGQTGNGRHFCARMLGFALTGVLALSSIKAFSQAIVTTLGGNYSGYKDGNTFNYAKFNLPAGIALDPSDTTLFMADYKNNAVRMVTAVGDKTSSYTYTAFAKAQGINHPIDVAVDQLTNVYVLNQGSGKNGTLMKFNGCDFVNYQHVSSWTTNATQLTNATALSLDNQDNAYVTVQKNTVLKITSGGIISVVGVITNTGTSLRGIVVMDDGRLALSDAGNNGIWMMDPANTNITSNAMQFTGFNGTGDQIGSASFASFDGPAMLAKAGNGVLVVADYNNAKVKVISTNGTVTRLFGINPQYWYGTKGWSDGKVDPNEQVDLVQARQPYGLAVAHDGTLYDTEDYYHLLRQATDTGLPQTQPPPPPVPTDLSITATSYEGVTLHWSVVGNAVSYNVKRAPSTGGPYDELANVSTNSYTDANVQSGTTYYYVVSAVNSGGIESTNSVEVSATIPIPPPPAPTIGWFEYVAGTPPTTLLHPVSGTPFITYNDLNLAILPNTGSSISGVSTYYTTDGSDPSETNSSSGTPPPYSDGQTFSQSLPVPAKADLTIKAINVNAGGQSAVASAEFIYKVGNPFVNGDNAAQFTLSDITAGTRFAYTTDGTDPRTNASATIVGPASGTNAINMSLPFPAGSNSMLFQVVGIKANYETSSIVSMEFSATHFTANTINFGFASGPGSCQFVASPGQTFLVPIGLDMLNNHPDIYGLQFNVTLTNLDSSIVDPSTIAFRPLIGKPDKENDGYYNPIPPLEFISTTPPNNDINAISYNGGWYQDLNFTDTNNNNLLGVGWLEIYGRTNLYDTKSQSLLTYPIRDGTDVTSDPNKMIIGSYGFDIPSNANPGDRYQIQLGRPSGTTFTSLQVDPYGTPVFFAAPADTNLVGPGSINAIKNVTIGQIKYLVGDVYPANWYNAGDFGSGNLQNIDVTRVFDFAAYPIASPPAKSDLFDALDSCGNFGHISQFGYYTNDSVYPYTTNFAVTNYTSYFDTNGAVVSTTATSAPNYTSKIYMTTFGVGVPYYITNIYLAAPPAAPMTNVVSTNYVVTFTPGESTLFDVAATDTNINQIAFGDGRLDVCDVYVTFRRSLDPNLTWFQRFWTNSERVAEIVPNVTPNALTKTTSSQTPTVQPLIQSSPFSPQVHFSAGDIQGSAGQVVQIPITAKIYGSYPLRVLMLNVTVEPLDGSPALTTPVQFTQLASLGSPYLTDSRGNGNYSAVWLNDTIAGVTGTVTLGNLTVTIPANAPADAAYAVHFDHASASPNGLASFPEQTLTGLVTLSSRTNSTYGDGIPDSWRLRWFGTVNNYLSLSNACPSGDGVNNWMKYVAGVDPNTPNDFPSTKAVNPPPAGATMAIHWPSVSGKQYVIERSTTLFPGKWTAIATNTGTGTDMEFDDNSGGSKHFYRVQILP